MAYPLEKQKGRFIAVFWVIFNLGAVIGALVPLAQNLHSTAPEVNDGTYYAFIALMLFGFLLACCACNPHFVVRKDGSRVILMKQPTWKSEFIGLFETLRSDWYIVFLFPFFLASNWFYTYHFQDVNFAYYNTRTRALNSVLYWSMQMVGALIFGTFLDMGRLSRRTRAKVGLAALFTLTMAIWGGGYAFQKTYTRAMTEAEDYQKKDFQDSGYIGPMFLYMFYGFYDAAFQTTAYWIIGSLSNNGRKLANFAGFYKGIQSAGGSISPSIDAEKVAFMTEFAANWGLLAGSILIAAPVVWMKVTNHTELEKDLVFTDETREEVVATDPTATDAKH
ncbi:UNC93-like protein [Cyphellophora attinorum]|uniref:UNC93-like protein n=1 Tax=Cyphellophora attinorum TaxID=1664694 RepID=A0A0N1HXV9_9EURO|nr:UNC93-like protein [Phialophora attinorum]KPI42960.1 UNC93-like protein [Phialophora attinorum]